MAAFRGMHSGESLDSFHQRCVVPTQKETSRRNAEIDGFVRFLHSEFNNPPYTVARVLKSGSLGKGTAVRDSADIDLVVILNGLRTISDLVAQRPPLLRRLEKAVDGYSPWRGKVQLQDKTRYSLCYLLNGQEVDILPAMDIAAYGSTLEIYKQMKSYPEGKVQAAMEFSASFAALQIEFVKPQDEALKKVIRLIKFWKKERHLDIRSYTLELLTIHTAEQGQWRDTEDLFRKVLTRLENCQSIGVGFGKHYSVCSGGSSDSVLSSYSPAFVVDPANPFMNTLHGTDLDAVSKAARDMLRRL
ncbi:hypothetical protein ACOMHN_046726 [Nucella lapillus]